MIPAQDSGVRRAAPPAVIADLHDAFTRRGMTLTDVIWEQHRLHESRRWSVTRMLSGIDPGRLTPAELSMAWNAGRAELTTKPGADRLERQADAECRRWQGENPVVAAVMQACGTWSRYWTEEEAHHEAAFLRLAAAAGAEPVPDETVIAYRRVFPDDDMLRTLMLLAISEITAAVDYGQCRLAARDPGLRRLFGQVASDEIQHRNYFTAFARALVDSGAYHAAGAFAVAHLFVRDGGELLGSDREQPETRDTHVNWWDQIQNTDGDGGFRPGALDRKQKLIFRALEKITGIRVGSAEETEKAWLDLLGT